MITHLVDTFSCDVGAAPRCVSDERAFGGLNATIQSIHNMCALRASIDDPNRLRRLVPALNGAHPIMTARTVDSFPPAPASLLDEIQSLPQESAHQARCLSAADY